MKNKNFVRISKLLLTKCEQINPLFGIVSPMFVDFVTREGERFFESKGQKAYLRTARMYWNILTKNA